MRDMSQRFQCLPGFRDFYPKDCADRNDILMFMRLCARRFGFEEYDAPVLEPLELFTAKSGEEIEQQLFRFTDRGGREVALRPEMTPSLVRMVGARIPSLKKPLRWFSIAGQFRYERPQQGRLRSFHQLNADILGEQSTNADAEIIALGVYTLQDFGLGPEDFLVHLSDRQLWALFLESRGVPPGLVPAVLTAVDRTGSKKMPAAPAHLVALAPEVPWGELLEEIWELCSLREERKLLSFLLRGADDPTIRSALDRRLETLSLLLSRLRTMGYGDYITLDFGIVRGLAYYTGFVFEFFERHSNLRALAGGGRYDDLFSKLGYPNTPAVGLAIGDVALQEVRNQKGILFRKYPSSEITLLFDSPASEKRALEDAELLRKKGYRVTYNLKQKLIPVPKQLRQVDPSDTVYLCIYEEQRPDGVDVYDVGDPDSWKFLSSMTRNELLGFQFRRAWEEREPS